ncbi:thiamine phosphate synthase, partial [Nocardia asiatica]|uniref:thiamine phosphate synthase n=1 Tax=Nocardia asiatica TaxID=209252 RepID=UPI00245636B7
MGRPPRHPGRGDSTTARRHGALIAVNDRADIALASGADVLHLGQGDLPPWYARRILGPDV